jgi:hypothetical protein
MIPDPATVVSVQQTPGPRRLAATSRLVPPGSSAEPGGHVARPRHEVVCAQHGVWLRPTSRRIRSLLCIQDHGGRRDGATR